MALAPYPSSTSTTPPPKHKNPPKHTPADALAEHIATQNHSPTVNYPSEASVFYEPQYPNPVNPYTMYMASLTSMPVGLTPLQQFAFKKARKAGVNPRFPSVFLAQIDQESNWNPNAVSSAGAQGIAQFMPATAAGMGLDDPFNPRAAIKAAVALDKQNYDKYGNFKDMLSLYNSGQGWETGQNIGETNNYVKSILGNADTLPQEIGDRPPGRKGLTELIYQNQFYKNGQMIPGIGGHDTHVHFAATNPRLLMKAYNKWGDDLSFGENPYTGKVYPVHADNSYHYQTFPGTFGPDNKKLGEAWDVNDPNPNDDTSLDDFFKWALNRYGGKGLYDYGSAPGGTAATVPDYGSGPGGMGHTTEASPGMAALISNAMSSEAPSRFGKRRKKGQDEDIIDKLIAALQQGQQGANMMGGY